jgi:cystathionine beta-lyase/cystathionine gamma-synthase/glycerol-3-phosphate dehydrogenase
VLCDWVLHHVRRIPRFLAKDTLFVGNGIVARTMRGAGQIPVHRHSANASLALQDAVDALHRGECIVIYPEGTVTRDPDTWPMLGKTGVARLALLSGRTVVPVGQWGAQPHHRHLPQQAAAPAPPGATDGHHRSAGRPLAVRGTGAHRRGAARRDRRRHDRHHRRGRAAARRAGTRARARPPARRAGGRQQHRRPEDRVTRAAVLGTGSWGTAFAKVLADAGTDVVLWARRPELAAAVRDTHENPDYLPGIALPSNLTATGDAREAVDGRGVRRARRAVAEPARQPGRRGDALAPGSVLVSLMKGVELGTTKRMSEVVIEVADVPASRVAVVSGPNLAKEIAQGQPAATVVACSDPDACERLQEASTTAYFRPYTNVDVVGCELGGAVKNVIALAVGMAEGMGFGDNTKASLITRGLAETSRLGAALGADPMTFMGLAGPGRPRGHVHLAAVAQPHVRREARPGRDARGAHRPQAADRRGREELPLDPRPRPQARRRHAHHRERGARGPRGRRPHGHGAGPDEPEHQGRVGTSVVPMTDAHGEGTRAVHTPPLPAFDQVPLALPVHRSSTYRFETAQQYADVLGGRAPGYTYARVDNPTADAFAAAVAALEGVGVDGEVVGQPFASGMAAITTVLMALTRSGAHVVAPAAVYGGTYGCCATSWRGSASRRRSSTRATPTRSARPCATRPRWSTPRRWPTRAPPWPTCRRWPRWRARPACRWSSTRPSASPALCRPLEHGADVVVQSATKFLGGHSDATGGVAVGSPELMAKVRRDRIDLGGALAPDEAFLLHRGLATLPLRVDQQCRTALELARALEAHPAVERVDHPGLPSHRDHALATKLFDAGRYGGVVTVTPRGGYEAGMRLCDGLRLVAVATSLGGVHSLVSHVASTTHRQLDDAALAAAGIAPAAVRISVGLEDADDVVADLVQALDAL